MDGLSNLEAPKKRVKTLQVRGLSLVQGKWSCSIQFDGRPNYLGYYADERSAALMYDQVGVDLQLPNFPVNLPNETPGKPLLSQVHLKADDIRQAAVSQNVEQTASHLIHAPISCDAERLDDVPLQTRLNSARKFNVTRSEKKSHTNDVSVT
jgi:hypothetical protein